MLEASILWRFFFPGIRKTNPRKWLMQENGDYNLQKWNNNGPAFSSIAGSGNKHDSFFFLLNFHQWYHGLDLTCLWAYGVCIVVGKDFEGEKETYSNAEWKERVEKWKTRQEKRGLVTKDDGGNDQGDDDDYLYDFLYYCLYIKLFVVHDYWFTLMAMIRDSKNLYVDVILKHSKVAFCCPSI